MTEPRPGARLQQLLYQPVTSPQPRRRIRKRRGGPQVEARTDFVKQPTNTRCPYEVLKYTKQHSSQQTHGGHKKEGSHPQWGGRAAGSGRARTRAKAQPGNSFLRKLPSLYTAGGISGTGSTCSQLGAAALADSQLLAACGPWQAGSVSQQNQGTKHHEGQRCNPDSAPWPTSAPGWQGTLWDKCTPKGNPAETWSCR